MVHGANRKVERYMVHSGKTGRCSPDFQSKVGFFWGFFLCTFFLTNLSWIIFRHINDLLEKAGCNMVRGQKGGK